MGWLNKIPKKKKNLAWRIIDGEAIVISLDDQPDKGEKIKVFNETATRMWELIDEKNTAVDIIKKIANEYDIGYKKAESNIMDFLNNLSKKRLVEFK